MAVAPHPSSAPSPTYATPDVPVLAIPTSDCAVNPTMETEYFQQYRYSAFVDYEYSVHVTSFCKGDSMRLRMIEQRGQDSTPHVLDARVTPSLSYVEFAAHTRCSVPRVCGGVRAATWCATPSVRHIRGAYRAERVHARPAARVPAPARTPNCTRQRSPDFLCPRHPVGSVPVADHPPSRERRFHNFRCPGHVAIGGRDGKWLGPLADERSAWCHAIVAARRRRCVPSSS